MGHLYPCGGCQGTASRRSREHPGGVLGWVDCPGAGNGAKTKMLESGKLEGDEAGLSWVEFEVFMDGATRGFLLLF